MDHTQQGEMVLGPSQLAERIQEAVRRVGESGPHDIVRRTREACAPDDGIGYGTARRLWTGTAGNPTRDTLQKFAIAYGVTVGWLLGEEEVDGTGSAALGGAFEPYPEDPVERIKGWLIHPLTLKAHPEYEDPRERLKVAMQMGKDLSPEQISELVDWSLRDNT